MRVSLVMGHFLTVDLLFCSLYFYYRLLLRVLFFVPFFIFWRGLCCCAVLRPIVTAPLDRSVNYSDCSERRQMPTKASVTLALNGQNYSMRMRLDCDRDKKKIEREKEIEIETSWLTPFVVTALFMAAFFSLVISSSSLFSRVNHILAVLQLDFTFMVVSKEKKKLERL